LCEICGQVKKPVNNIHYEVNYYKIDKTERPISTAEVQEHNQTPGEE